MANMNKYKKWYFFLMERAKGRPRLEEENYEVHHIIPKCLGGEDRKINLVSLTVREHFLAHWLLTKFYDGEDKKKMLLALAMMKKGRRVLSSWQYELSRRAASEGLKGNQHLKGYVHSKETRSKISSANTGRKCSKEFGEKVSRRLTGNTIWVGRRHRQETIDKNKIWHTGRKLSSEIKEKISKKALGRKLTSDHRKKLAIGQQRRRAREREAMVR